MSYFLQNIDLLENLPSRVLIFDGSFIYRLDCNFPASQFMYPQCDLAESAFPK